jgi:hypothetical protein
MASCTDKYEAMTANNVVAFPKVKRNTPAQTMDEVWTQVNAARADHVDIVLEWALQYVGQRISDEGFDIYQPKCVQAMFMVENLLKAAMYRSIDLYHPLADLAEDVYRQVEAAITIEEQPPSDSN